MVPAALRNRRKRSYESDSESSGSDYLSESEASDVNEEEPEPVDPPITKKKQRTVSAPVTSVNEVELFTALSHDGVAIVDLALNWIETAEDDATNGTTDALTELFNLILRCCGCNHLAEKHDLSSYDSAPATVAEVGHVFKRQKTHEYPFIAKGKNTKFFRRNVTEFFETVVEIAHEKGLLYKDNTTSGDSSLSSPLMNAFLAWLFALSSSEYRPFRYVTTSLLYAVQEKLCKLATTSTLSVEKQQRQLTNAQNNTRARNKEAHERKIELITQNINVSKMQRDAILEYLGDIFQNVFNSRYRDVDVLIRVESLKALALWATAYGDMFLQANYLRYFGWMLSDPADLVEREAIRGILKLYRNVTSKGEPMSIGLRQLTESFKNQLLSMLWIDSSIIKASLFSVYVELTKLGFLDKETDICQICLYGFYIVESSVAVEISNPALNAEYCQFINTICELHASSEMEEYSQFLSSHESLFFGDGEDQLDMSSCLKFKSLIETLKNSFSLYCSVERPKLTIKKRELSFEIMVKRLMNTMYGLLSFQGKWETFVRYMLLDVSLVQFSVKDDLKRGSSDTEEAKLKERLLLSTRDMKHVALCIFSGMLLRVLTSPIKKTSNDRNLDDLDVALPVLVNLLPKLESFLNSALNLYTVFLNIWNSLLVALPSSITKLFSLHSSVEIYTSIHSNVLAYFIEMDILDKELSQSFETFFAVMFRDYNGRSSMDALTHNDKLLNSQITIKFEDVVSSLVMEANEASAINTPDILHSPNEIEDDEAMIDDQRLFLTRLQKVQTAAQKLSQIAKSTNINRFLSEPLLESPNSFLELIQAKLISKYDMGLILQRLPESYSRQAKEISQLWSSLIRLILLAFCWSVEDLTYASGDSSASSIDVGVFLADYADIIPSLCSIFISVLSGVKDLNDSVTEGSNLSRNLVETLVRLSSMFAANISDLLGALRSFYLRFNNERVFKNFNEFFQSQEKLEALVEGNLDESIQDALLNDFLLKEASLGKILRVPLERGYDEDVNIDEYLFDNNEGIEVVEPEITETVEGDEVISDEVTAKLTLLNSVKKFNAEKDLCGFTLKLLILEKTGAFSTVVCDRIRLNEPVLGELFAEVIKLGKIIETSIETS